MESHSKFHGSSHHQPETVPTIFLVSRKIVDQPVKFSSSGTFRNRPAMFDELSEIGIPGLIFREETQIFPLETWGFPSLRTLLR